MATTIPFNLSGTAVNGTDYSNVTVSPLVIAAGQTSATITGSVAYNGAASTNPTLVFTLGTPSNASPGSQTTDTLTIAESTSTIVDVGGLEFQTANGFSLTGNTDTTSDPVQVGFQPASGQSFVPLLTLLGGTTIDTSALTITNTGAVNTAIGGSSATLLSGGFNNASISALTGSGLTGLAGASFTVAHFTFSLDTLALNATGANGPEVQLQGLSPVVQHRCRCERVQLRGHRRHWNHLDRSNRHGQHAVVPEVQGVQLAASAWGPRTTPPMMCSS